MKLDAGLNRPFVCRSRFGTMLSATATAEPLELAPGVCSGLWGLRVLLGRATAYSLVTVLPIITAPANRNRSTTAASYPNICPVWIGVPHPVGISAVAKVSLMPIGMPWSTRSDFRKRLHGITLLSLLECIVWINVFPCTYNSFSRGNLLQAILKQLHSRELSKALVIKSGCSSQLMIRHRKTSSLCFLLVWIQKSLRLSSILSHMSIFQYTECSIRVRL